MFALPGLARRSVMTFTAPRMSRARMRGNAVVTWLMWPSSNETETTGQRSATLAAVVNVTSAPVASPVWTWK